LDFLVRLGLNFHPMGEFGGGGGGEVDWASDIFLSRTDRNVTRGGATKNTILTSLFIPTNKTAYLFMYLLTKLSYTIHSTNLTVG